MRAWLVPLALCVGCGSAVSTAAEGSSTEGGDDLPSANTDTATPTSGSASETTSRASATTDDEGTTTSSAIDWETEGADEGYATTGGCGFTCPQPPSPPPDCNFTDAGCGDDGKCMPWANDGGYSWTSVRCVPLDPEPAGLGDPCTVEGSFMSGIDSCGSGLWCGPENPDDARGLTGICHRICNAGPCPDGTLCVIPSELDLGICQEQCDPLEPACSDGHACMPAAGVGFACHPAVPNPKGLNGGCTGHSHCAAGSACVDAPQCGDDGETCCVPYCDLDAPVCADGQTCVGSGSPLPEFEDVGYCAG